MVKKLNFLFISKARRLLWLKVLFFVLILSGLYFWNFSITALAIFVISVFWLYFSQLSERKRLRSSFIILFLMAFLILRLEEVNFGIFLGETIFLSLLFYLLLGLDTFIFKNPKATYLFLNTGLFLIIFLFFCGLGGLNYFWGINFLLFFIIFFLSKECFLRNSIHQPLFFSLVITFLTLELFWVINLLPIGFVNSAIFLTIFVFLARDFILAYFSGQLNRRFIISQFLIFSFLGIIIFIFSKWNL
jgi:hypothetical protein